MHCTRWTSVISGHLKCRLVPDACSEMMYSLPISLAASALQSRILGMGMLVFRWTDQCVNICICSVQFANWTEILRYLTVATSDAVVRQTGPAIWKGNFAMVRWPSSSVKTKTRLEPPSIFSQVVILLALQRERIFWHSALKSKLMWRSWSSWFSLQSQRPPV